MPPQDQTGSSTANEPLFSPPSSPGGFPKAAVGLAVALVLVAVIAFALLGRRSNSPAPNTLQAEAPYAASLSLSNVAMSQASSFSGLQTTYIEGHIANHGPSTVTGITVQVVFSNDVQMPAQLQMLPVMLIRTREPYVDTEPVSAAPLAPGGEADFRLTPDPIYQNWNQQLPQIRITHVSSR